ncbi:MAG TPA: polyamine ABC transporter ATP-binding protein [Rhodospirillaceae bacterium]|nr:polyamine ABC transporter ATP-binding protein [Magnetovibrio sp.]MAY66834.1 polyamine ABC transporter ATP-binding protein [Rhodospirillaceae bacterium]HBC08815.1 polyamine ABC transporter ATP-binding protein [Rhodospirillaceae bacterium]
MALKQTSGVTVTVENVSLSFGKTEVLKGVNLEIKPGELFTFLGPSGSGKSTLLRSIAGFGPRPGGRILIDGDDIAGLAPWDRNVGMVFQSYALWPHMTVRKNVAFGLEERKVPAREIAERVEAALDLVGLAAYGDRRPSQLSGGQQQRVALARTIVVEPRVLLLDEPLSNLDANLRVQMRREIHDLQRKLNLTTIFVTHDQEEANTISDRMAVLDQGVIQQTGTPLNLYDNPANRFVASFLGTANLLEGRIEAGDGGLWFIADAGPRLRLTPDAGAAGDRTAAMMRPQNLTITDADGALGQDVAVLEGTVEMLEFLGTIVRYAVRVGGASMLVDETHRVGRAVHAVGDSVRLGVEAADIRLLSA